MIIFSLTFQCSNSQYPPTRTLTDRRTKVNVKATGGKWTGKTALDVTEGMGMQGKPEVIQAIKKKGGKPGK